MQPLVKPFFEEVTNTYSYVVSDPQTDKAAIIDSVLNFDYASGTTSYDSADEIINYVQENNLSVEWIIETHAHADHLSAAPYLKKALGGTTAIGKKINEVQQIFTKIFNIEDDVATDGSQFDHLFNDEERYQIGHIEAKVIATPGHTPACMTHIIGDAVFVGDTIFMPDGGTARADFPGGSATILYQSIQKILSLPEDYRIFVCHDYGPNERDYECETTVKKERLENIHVKSGIREAEFVSMREKRDVTLTMPKLILPSLQVNIRAGHLPKAEDNGMCYLKVPLNAFK